MRFFLTVVLYCFLLDSSVEAKVYLGDTNISSANEQQASFIGLTNLKNSSFHSITVVGPLSFSNLKVANMAEIIGKTENSQNGKFGQLFITGTFNASNVQCDQLKAIGFIEISNLHVRENTDVSGYLLVHAGHLNDIEFMGREIQLDNVEANNIMIKSDILEPETQQALIITGSTVIKGNVTFNSGRGIIKQSSKAKIMGPTKGAALQKLDQ